MAGWLGAAAGTATAFLVLAALGAMGLFAALVLWPKGDAEEVEHIHDRLPAGHTHLGDAQQTAASGFRHSHAFVIDELHQHWPR